MASGTLSLVAVELDWQHIAYLSTANRDWKAAVNQWRSPLRVLKLGYMHQILEQVDCSKLRKIGFDCKCNPPELFSAMFPDFAAKFPGHKDSGCIKTLSKCDGVEFVATHCPQLTDLELTETSNASFVVTVFAQHCPLKRIKLHRCLNQYSIPEDTGIAEAESALKSIGEYCPQLEELDLSVNWAVTDAGLISLATKCTQLKKLNLAHACRGNFEVRLTDAGICAVARHCPLLQMLVMSPCDSMTDESLWAVALGCRQLRHLSISGGQLTAAPLQELMQCRQLQYLCFKDTRITAVKLAPLMHCWRACQQLRVDVGDHASDTLVKAVAGSCPQMQDLLLEAGYPVEISDASASTNAVISLARNCVKLRNLELGGLDAIDDTAIEAIASNCSELRTLNAAYCANLTDQAVIALAQHSPQLEELNIVHCSQVRTVESLVELVHNCQKLKHLRLGGFRNSSVIGTICEIRPLNISITN